MNQWSRLLREAVDEVEQWQHTHPADVEEVRWYCELRRILERATAAASLEEAINDVKASLYMIADGGPLTVDFAPSLAPIAAAIQHQGSRFG